jgi:Lhr-like helicase
MEPFHPAVAAWFARAFPGPTPAQKLGWPVIARGESALILAPTGSGKTLAAFLWCVNRLMFEPPPAAARCRVLYVSPLKALAADIERNLRAPIAGIAGVARDRGDPCHVPAVAVRTGDTPAADRARFQRAPADILVTTPESLYLLLTSNAREALRAVDTVIVDEIHALVPTKRGAHLALSIERLERLAGRRLQRIGLSATVRPIDEVARFLGGVERPAACEAAREPPGRDERTRDRSPAGAPGSNVAAPAAEAGRTGPRAGSHANPGSGTRTGRSTSRDGARVEPAGAGDIGWRPVTVVDAGRTKALELTLEVPVEDMARLDEPVAIPSGPAAQGPARPSIWTAVHPRLLALVRAHRSTLIFVNSRRLAERLAAALNELAGETLVLAHHGSLARAQRIEVEDRLKSGRLRGLVATSSLELGIDMGAVDLVVQVEAPPSVASGLQRIGRAGHHVDAPSRGIIVPKYRGDLLACAAATRAMLDGQVEATRYPRTPLDVLAQQVVAMAAMDRWTAGDLYDVVRRAAPYATLGRAIGALVRTLDELPAAAARERLVCEHRLDARAAENLLQYLRDQKAATRVLPDDHTILVERCRDELGDWRVCVLSPFGSQVLAPWALAASARIREQTGLDLETMWTDDGFVVRFPETERPPETEWLVPPPEDVERLVVSRLGSSPLLAAAFRESAARALLLPRRRPGARTPLWQQRKRASDLLAVAARFGDFPILLEAYRECLRDVFDLPALVSLMADVRDRAVRLVTVDTATPSPFAASVLFGYVATYLYDGDAARRTPGTGARHRPRPAPGARRRDGAARPARRRRSRGSRAPAPAPRSRLPRAKRRRPARSAPADRRSHHRGRCRPVGGPCTGLDRGAPRDAPCDRAPHRGRVPPGGRRGCRALPRRARHAAPAGHPGFAARAGGRPAGRPRAAACAHARAVHRRRGRRAVRGWAGRSSKGCCAG